MPSRHGDVKVNVWTCVPLIVVSTALHYTSSGAVCRHVHGRRSVVKMGGRVQSGQAIKLYQAPRTFIFTFHF